MRFAGTQLTNFIDPTNFDPIGKSFINGQSMQNQAVMKGEGLVDRTDIQAEAEIEAAKFGASATRAQGAAQGQASMFSGLSSGIGSLAGGFAKMPGAGGTPGPAVPAVDRTSLGHGIPGSVGGNGLPVYGPGW
jgi:hypothetical protein